MATTTFHDYTGDGSDLTFNYSFPTFSQAEVVVEVGGVIVDNYTIPSYATSGTKTVTFDNSTGTVNTNVCESSGAPKNTLLVRIRRNTNVDSRKADYTAGSSLKAADLTNNNDQLLRSAQENTLKTDTITTLMVKNAQITRDKIAADAINGTKIADDSVDSEHIVADSIDTEHYAPSSVDTTAIADNAVTLAKIAGGALPTDITVASANIVDGTIVNADISSSAGIAGSKLADDGVTYAKIQNVSATNRILGRDSASAGIIEEITPANLRTMINVEDGATADQTASEVKSLIASSPLDSSHLATNSVTVNELADNAVDRAAIAADAVDGTKLADDAVTTEHYTDNSIQRVHLQADIVDGTKIADDSVDSEHLVADSIDTEHYAPGSIDPTALATNSVETAKIENAKLTTLAGMQAGTASILASSTALTSTTAELNLLDGKSIVTSVSSSSTNDQIPTAAAVNTQIANLLDQTGGFVPIATEAVFPNAHPDASNDTGTIVSIADAGGLVVNGSGVATNAATVGGTAVTINGIDSSLYSTTIAAGKGMLVQTTAQSDSAYASGPVYTYHRLIVDEAGVATAQALVSNFNERYRTDNLAGGGNPTSSLDAGDLFFNQSTGKMMVYNGVSSAWEEVQSIGNFFISTLSPAFNGSLQDFTISNAPTNAQQIILSINGVVQKPNSGTSTPSEGFALSGTTIKLSSAPASSADYFAVVIGSTVNIGTPSDNTVDSDIIQNGAVITAKIADDAVDATKLASNSVVSASIVDGSIVNADINASAAIARTKLANVDLVDDTSPQLGGTLDTNGNAVNFADNIQAVFGTGNDSAVRFNGTDFVITTAGKIKSYAGGTGFEFYSNDNSDTFAKFIKDGAVELYHDNVKALETINLSSTRGVKIGQSINIYRSDYGNGNIQNTAGNLYIEAKAGETAALFKADGGVELNFDNSKKFQTDTSGAEVFGSRLRLADNVKVALGSGADLQIYHNGNNSFIEDTGTGDFYIRGADNIRIQSYSDNEDMAKFIKNGAVELYYDNSKKLQTDAAGVIIYGNLYQVDNNKLMLGNSSDLQIYHDGSSSRFYNATGDLVFRSAGYYLNSADGSENIIKGLENAQVELYYNNAKKLETTNGGVSITGDLRIADDEHIYFGTGADLQIRVGSNNDGVIDQVNGDLKFQKGGSGKFTIKSDGTHFSDDVFPSANNTYDLGSTSLRWRNIYTNDLNLSNQGSSNDVDGTWGDWTIQEGESDLFLKNNRSGKKYKFNLTEIS